MPAVLHHPHPGKKVEDDSRFFFAIMEEMEKENQKETLTFRSDIDKYLTYKKLNAHHMQYLFCFYGAYFASLSFYAIQGHPGIVAFSEVIVGLGGLLLLWLGFKISFPYLRHEDQIMDYLNNRARKQNQAA